MSFYSLFFLGILAIPCDIFTQHFYWNSPFTAKVPPIHFTPSSSVTCPNTCNSFCDKFQDSFLLGKQQVLFCNLLCCTFYSVFSEKIKISEKFAKFPPRREDSVCLQEVVSNGNGFHTPMFDYPVAFASVFNITHYFCRSVYYLGLEDELSLTCLKSLLEYRPNSPRTLIMLALLYIKLGDGNKATFCAKLAIQVVTRIGLGDDLQVVATKHYDYLPFSDEMIYSDWKTSENFLERSYYILMWALNEKRGLSEIVCIGMSRIFAQVLVLKWLFS